MSMTDEQLLRDAAKATGRNVLSIHECAVTAVNFAIVETQNDDGTVSTYTWSPQANDIDAFRMETDLGMLIDHLDDCVIVSILDKERVLADIQENYEDHPDKYTARRYAITRAAAEVGRQQ